MAAKFLPKWNKPAIVGSCLSLSILFCAQGSQADIREFWVAVDIAQARNPIIHRAEAEYRAAREDSPKALAKLLPDIDFRASHTFDSGTHYRKLGTATHERASKIELLVNQPLYNRQDALDYEQSEPLLRAVIADVVTARQDVSLQVATVASNWLESKEVLELADRYRKVTLRHREVNRLRQEAGESTQTDVEEASSRAAQAEASYADALNTLEQEAAFFREIVGEYPKNNMTLPDLYWEDPPNVDQQFARWVEDRPDIRAGRSRYEQADYEVKIERAEHYPTIDLTFNASRTWNAELGGSAGISLKEDQDEHSLAVILNLPLFSGGETNARTREAKANREWAMAELERLRKLAIRKASEARYDWKNSEAAIVSLEKALFHSEKALSGMEEEFLVGTRTLLDLLDFQYEVYTLNTSLVRQRYQAQLARIRLWKELGRILHPQHIHSTAYPDDWPRPRRYQEEDVIYDGSRTLALRDITRPFNAKRRDELSAVLNVRSDHNDPADYDPDELLDDEELDVDGVLDTLVTQMAQAKESPSVRETVVAMAAPEPPAYVAAPESMKDDQDTLLVMNALVAEMAQQEVVGERDSHATRVQGTIPAASSQVMISTFPESQAKSFDLMRGFPTIEDGPLLVHVASFADRKYLEENRQQLAEKGIPSHQEAYVMDDGAQVTRVVVGPFVDFRAAFKAKDLIRKNGFPARLLKNHHWHNPVPGPKASKWTASKKVPTVSTDSGDSGVDQGLDMLIAEFGEELSGNSPTTTLSPPGNTAGEELPLEYRQGAYPDKKIDSLPFSLSYQAVHLSKRVLPLDFPEIKDGPFLVHMGAFADPGELLPLVKALDLEGIPSWVDPLRAPDGSELARLLVGPFYDYGHIWEVVDIIKEIGVPGGWMPTPNWQRNVDQCIEEYTKSGQPIRSSDCWKIRSTYGRTNTEDCWKIRKNGGRTRDENCRRRHLDRHEKEDQWLVEDPPEAVDPSGAVDLSGNVDPSGTADQTKTVKRWHRGKLRKISVEN
ncbi:MAG: TolC family outer membrane protein [Magnetococcales bacterium]|nr:TolC family outer membrane protein [Magnetococcales bacterium]